MFKAMLGETDFFDEFSGTQFDTVATVLLATYLVIMTIMMLNLLVAVLSTAHARVDQNADQEYKVQDHMPHIYAVVSSAPGTVLTANKAQALMGVGLRLAMSERLGDRGVGCVLARRSGYALYVSVKVHLDMLLTSWLLYIYIYCMYIV